MGSNVSEITYLLMKQPEGTYLTTRYIKFNSCAVLIKRGGYWIECVGGYKWAPNELATTLAREEHLWALM